MKVSQVFKFKPDKGDGKGDGNKKHSVIYVPETEDHNNPAICSSVYISRLVLPKGHTEKITLTLDIPEKV